MSLFKETIASEVAKVVSWLPPTGPLLKELYSRKGFYIFGFSIHSLEGEFLQVNLIVAAWDFLENPSFRGSLPDSYANSNTIGLPLEGDKSYSILDHRRYSDFALLLCVSESEAEHFVKLMRFLRAWGREHGVVYEDESQRIPEFYHWQPAFQIDEKTNKIVGAMSFDACLRSHYASVLLRKSWEKTFDGSCPTELTAGLAEYTEGLPFIRPDGTRTFLPPEQAIRHPLMRSLSPEWCKLGALISLVREGEPPRLAHWKPSQSELDEAGEQVTAFCSNIFRLLHIAHRHLSGSFSCDFGSSLTASNVDAEGWVHDLETFCTSQTITLPKDSNTIFGDTIPLKHQLEDLILGLELLQLFCSKVRLEMAQYAAVRLAYCHYTGRPTCLDPTDEFVSNSNSLLARQHLARRMYADALWRKE